MTAPETNPPSASAEASSSGAENLWPAMQGLCGELTEAEQTMFFELLAHSSSARQELARAVLLDDCVQDFFSEEESQVAAASRADECPPSPAGVGHSHDSEPLPRAMRVVALPDSEPVRNSSVRVVLAAAVACLLLVCGLLLTGIPVPHSLELASGEPAGAQPAHAPGETASLPALLWVELTLSGDGSLLLPGEQELNATEQASHLSAGAATDELLLPGEPDESLEVRDSVLNIPEWMLVAVTTAAMPATGDPTGWPGQQNLPGEKQEQ